MTAAARKRRSVLRTQPATSHAIPPWLAVVPDGPPLLNIYQRMLAIMGELERVQKEKKKVNNEYRFVSHDAVMEVVHPLCVKHGVFIKTTVPRSTIVTVERSTQKGKRVLQVCELELECTFINVDDPDESFAVVFPGTGTDNDDKCCGKAASYAMKTALLKQFQLAGSEDNEASNNETVTGRKVIEPKSNGVDSRTNLPDRNQRGRREESGPDSDLVSVLIESIAKAASVADLKRAKAEFAKHQDQLDPTVAEAIKKAGQKRQEELGVKPRNETKRMREPGED